MNIQLISQVLEVLERLLLLLSFSVQSLTIAGSVHIVRPCGIDDLQENQSTVCAQQALNGGEVWVPPVAGTCADLQCCRLRRQ